MNIWLERIVIKNRAPFESLDIQFDRNEIAILSAINGSGKTTLLSYIVDAWHEMIRGYFPSEFEGKENKYYRISSPIFCIHQNEPSYVYIRFKSDSEQFDYFDIRNGCSEEYYNLIPINNKIPYEEIKGSLQKERNSKFISKLLDKEKAESIFNNNVITYFPAYRHEIPGYLNDPYKFKFDFAKEHLFSGYLPNPIEVIAGLPQLANWIMDVVLDMDLYKETQNINGQIIDVTPERTILWANLNKIIAQTLISKKDKGSLRFGIGKRNSGTSRIAIMSDKLINGTSISEQVYPSIFNLSSGEASMLCIFGEILRQADVNRNNTLLEQITGIVLIDEVDKHLHIKLQKEVLPQLFNLFPSVQFILSSHSPFLSLGLAEAVKDRTRIIDIDNLGISKDPTVNELYLEVYAMMVSENERYRSDFILLQKEIEGNSKPLIITEGKTDWKHFKKALKCFQSSGDYTDIDVDFLEYEDEINMGDSHLESLLKNFSKVKQSKKIIGIFDCDEANGKKYASDRFKNLGNNVFVFSIQKPEYRRNHSGISVELLYQDFDIQKADSNNRRLYLTSEFNERGRLISNVDISCENTEKIKRYLDANNSKIIDDGVTDGKDNFALSKNCFANNVLNEIAPFDNVDFDGFKCVFEIIREIIAINMD